MPKLWSATIDLHRRAVRDAVLDAAAAIVAKDGITAVKMARIAQDTGIGRATLYKYYPDVEGILQAWHRRQVQSHLGELTRVAASITEPRARLAAVLESFAERAVHDHGAGVSALLHRGPHLDSAHRKLHELLSGLIADGAGSAFRDDVPPAEVANFCLHAVTAASRMRSKAAVRRLVEVTLGAVVKGKTR